MGVCLVRGAGGVLVLIGRGRGNLVEDQLGVWNGVTWDGVEGFLRAFRDERSGTSAR